MSAQLLRNNLDNNQDNNNLEDIRLSNENNYYENPIN